MFLINKVEFIRTAVTTFLSVWPTNRLRFEGLTVWRRFQTANATGTCLVILVYQYCQQIYKKIFFQFLFYY